MAKDKKQSDDQKKKSDETKPKQAVVRPTRPKGHYVTEGQDPKNIEKRKKDKDKDKDKD